MGFKCGFYTELNELRKEDVAADFGFLENLRVTSESSAYNFLHGSCADFAAILSDLFGYKIECVRSPDNRLIHAYCVTSIGNEKAYVDVRGITTNPALFFSEFENELSYYPPTNEIVVMDEDGFEEEAKLEVWHDKAAGFDGEFEGWTDPEIEAFINDYKEYYDSDRYISIYRCKACGSEFEEIDDEDYPWFEDVGEEALWGHLQFDHPKLFEECQNLETPDMLELCYGHTIERKGWEPERLGLGSNRPTGERRSLDAIISDANDTLHSRKGPDDGPGDADAPSREMTPEKELPDVISR